MWKRRSRQLRACLKGWTCACDDVRLASQPIGSRKAEIQTETLPMLDRKSTRLNSITNAHLVCRLLLEKKKKHEKETDTNHNHKLTNYYSTTTAHIHKI